MATNSNSTTQPNKGTSFMQIVLLAIVALSLVALGAGIAVYSDGDMYAASWLILLGFVGAAGSIYVYFQSRKRIASLKIEIPPVMTTIECKKCGFKSTREFQRGDYVFKELEACQKCPEEKQMITAIYKEVKDKDKEKPLPF